MSNIIFSGKLEFLKLSELIQIIGNNEFTGILRLQSLHHPAPGLIYFENGNPVESDIGTLTGMEALNALFGWQAGNFIFTNEPPHKKRVIYRDSMGIIMEGLRLVDEGKTKIINAHSEFNPGKESAATFREMIEVKGPPVDYVYVVDEESFRDGDVIAKEGRYSRWLWVVLGGMVEIVKETKNGDMGIFRLSEGGFIGGFTSFLPGDHLCGIGAIARGRVQLGVLDVPRLSGEYAVLSPAFRRFVIGMENRLKGVTARLIDIRGKKAITSGIPKGLEPFSLEGERTTRGLFVINKGKAAVVRHTNYGPVLLARLSPGDPFGHMPVLDIGHEPYAASIYSTPDLQISPLDSKAFLSEYHCQSATFRNLLEHVSAGIAITTKLAIDAFLKRKEVRIPLKKQRHGGSHQQRGVTYRGKAMTEKRKSVRVNSLNLFYIIINDEDTTVCRGMGRTLNLSETGVLLETYFLLESGYNVLLSIGLADDLVEVKGKVVHHHQLNHDKYVTGISFFEVTEAAIQVVKKFIQVHGKHFSAKEPTP